MNKTELPLEVLILAFIRPSRVESLVKELRNQDAKVRIHVSVDLANHSHKYYDANVRCVELLNQMLSAGEIDSLRISRQPAGCFLGVSNGVSWFFTLSSVGLILEEDLIVHKKIVFYAKRLRELFTENVNLGSISLYSPDAGQNKSREANLYKTHYPTSWGWMTTAEKWECFISNVDSFKIPKWSRGGYSGYRRWSNTIKRIKSGTLDTWAFRWMFTHWEYGWYTLTPFPGGLIRNAGFDDLATHTKPGGIHQEAIVGEFFDGFTLNRSFFENQRASRKIERLILCQRFGIYGNIFTRRQTLQ